MHAGTSRIYSFACGHRSTFEVRIQTSHARLAYTRREWRRKCWTLGALVSENAGDISTSHVLIDARGIVGDLNLLVCTLGVMCPCQNFVGGL